jgi:hypothetical protein
MQKVSFDGEKKMVTIKRWDIVKLKTNGLLHGFVKRVSKDQSWCDVEWKARNKDTKEIFLWTKRMRCDGLDVITTVDIGDGWTMTDCNREAEIKQEMASMS